jgi:hypothetical protein
MIKFNKKKPTISHGIAKQKKIKKQNSIQYLKLEKYRPNSLINI